MTDPCAMDQPSLQVPLDVPYGITEKKQRPSTAFLSQKTRHSGSNTNTGHKRRSSCGKYKTGTSNVTKPDFNLGGDNFLSAAPYPSIYSLCGSQSGMNNN